MPAGAPPKGGKMGTTGRKGKRAMSFPHPGGPSSRWESFSPLSKEKVRDGLYRWLRERGPRTEQRGVPGARSGGGEALQGVRRDPRGGVLGRRCPKGRAHGFSARGPGQGGRGDRLRLGGVPLQGGTRR